MAKKAKRKIVRKTTKEEVESEKTPVMTINDHVRLAKERYDKASDEFHHWATRCEQGSRKLQELKARLHVAQTEYTALLEKAKV